ncbi:aldehyde ferredoxin oxidoreductase N-terminal domain-containing protein [Candidatus Methanocrinis natronophilus]|uniref:Aldehyde ferredoxin oxidoreductase N-terminal domain-containing protein n=1 Tax=Candidatus Methanocrinis natronophilus TaxID=3033396 RepID=A0ABT5X5L4_9EURY|nr:aldehyde ferredoxin oxidoreductase N-terminal domain-containing protein [Candidatus Methanocrinis natronophilus]MDF0589970.1 aldehyde ferredoxin oxidoreductase N-terminal domain-containing protein [Candidatus Methanocrinis natronophilus]
MSSTGLILRANLGRGEISEERIDPRVPGGYVGGRGLGAKILSDETDPRSYPLAPDMRVVFAAGPLSGTGAPTSGRFSASFKSPLTGLLTDSNCGGFFGPWIKRAGYDAIVVQGRAEGPSYLVVSDEGSDIRDAGDLWGKVTGETNRILEERHAAKVATIGPAGERGALISNVIVNGRRALGRGEPKGGRRLREDEGGGRGPEVLRYSCGEGEVSDQDEAPPGLGARRDGDCVDLPPLERQRDASGEELPRVPVACPEG